jgi:hypothetical protein
MARFETWSSGTPATAMTRAARIYGQMTSLSSVEDAGFALEARTLPRFSVRVTRSGGS